MVYLWIFILAFFAVIGVCEFCKGIVKVLIKPKSDNGIILIEPICQNQEDAEYLLRSAAQKIKWMGKYKPDRIICLDCNLDESTKRICKLVCNDYSFMEMLTMDEFFEELNNIPY